GSFKIGGLVGGNVQLMLSLIQSRTSPTDIEIVSVDQDGVPQPKGIDLKKGEQLSGIRVLARYKNLTGAIHGQVNFENGEPPPGTQTLHIGEACRREAVNITVQPFRTFCATGFTRAVFHRTVGSWGL